MERKEKGTFKVKTNYTYISLVASIAKPIFWSSTIFPNLDEPVLGSKVTTHSTIYNNLELKQQTYSYTTHVGSNVNKTATTFGITAVTEITYPYYKHWALHFIRGCSDELCGDGVHGVIKHTDRRDELQTHTHTRGKKNRLILKKPENKPCSTTHIVKATCVRLDSTQIPMIPLPHTILPGKRKHVTRCAKVI